MTFESLAKQIKSINPKRARLVVGVDGGGGAGKSTFAKILSQHLHADIFSLDMLYKPVNRRVNEHQDSDVNVDFDWERIDNQVFNSIQEDQPIVYQEYDWATDKLTNTYTIPAGSPLIIEGGYCLQKKYFDFYDFTVWIEAAEDIRLKRVLARDGEHMRPSWEKAWLPAERRYMEIHQPKQKASLVVDGISSDFLNNQIINQVL